MAPGISQSASTIPMARSIAVGSVISEQVMAAIQPFASTTSTHQVPADKLPLLLVFPEGFLIRIIAGFAKLSS